MHRITSWLKKRVSTLAYGHSDRLIEVYLSRTALLSNIKAFSALSPQTALIPVLKSNAYGHGLTQVAHILEDALHITHGESSPYNHIPFFMVDSHFEAQALRASGISTPLLIAGYTFPSTITASKLKAIRYTITSLEQLHELHEIALELRHAPIIIHLKVDTGMNRQGIKPHQIEEAFSLIKKSQTESYGHIILEGIMSHFSDSDSTDAAGTSTTRAQITLWNTIVKDARASFPDLAYWHTSNTAGYSYIKDIDANASRLGGGLYGLTLGASLESKLTYKPVMSIMTVVSSVKHVKAGENIGYSSTFTAPKDMTIATIPMGYYEGIDRRLSNKGFVKVITPDAPRGTLVPIVGRVSMNITTIDITSIAGISAGSQVEVVSPHHEDTNSLASLATSCGTITYELAVHISPHLARTIID